MSGKKGVIVIDPQRESEKKRLYGSCTPGVKGDTKYYAVARGRMVGVVKGWDHVSPHITGLKKPVCYKGFATEAEAWEWLTETKKKLMRKLKKTRRVTRQRPKPGGKKDEVEDYESDEDYTDYEESSEEEDATQRAPRRAPPPPPPKKKIDETTVETGWMGSQKYTTDKVWLVEDEQQGEEEVEQLQDVDLSSTPVAAQYDISTVLGRGAFSIVKLGKHKQSGQQVALKIISSVSNPDFSISATAKEVEVLKLLSGAGADKNNVVSLKSDFQLPTARVIALDLLEPSGVFSELASNNNKYTEEDARKLVSQLLNAVSFLHKHNVVHRDIVPENLLLTSKGPAGILKLVGFSMASISAQSTPFDGLVGTPSTQPPEIANRQHFSKASDIWSVGVLTYALISGKFPFQDGNVMRLNVKIRKAEYDTPAADWANVSQSAKDFIKQLITVDPAKRPTADQAKQHAWIKTELKNPPNLATFRANIQDSFKNNVWN